MEPLSPTLIFSIFTACNVATIQNLLHFGAGTNIRWQNRSFRMNLWLFATLVGLSMLGTIYCLRHRTELFIGVYVSTT